MKIKEGYAKIHWLHLNKIYIIERHIRDNKLFAVMYISHGIREGEYVNSDEWTQVYQLEFFDIIHEPKEG